MLSIFSSERSPLRFLRLLCFFLTINVILSNETFKTISHFKRDAFGPGTYAFGYEINDKKSGNLQFRDEKRYTNGTVIGSYGLLQPDNSITVTHYVAGNTTGYQSTMDTYESSGNPSIKAQINLSQNLTKYNPLRLNITSIEVPNNITDSLVNQFDMKTNLTVLPDVLVDPLINSILNGSTVEITTVRNLLPTTFPIAPFMFPQSNLTSVAKNITKLPNPKPLVSKDTTEKT